MTVNSAAVIFFSPTGNTKKVLKSILSGMNVPKTRMIDLTSPTVRASTPPIFEEDIVILGSPVYQSKVPPVLPPYLRNLKGNGKPIVLVSVYGNIEQGIVLNELASLAAEAGFSIFAAGSFIGEHSFSTDKLPIGEGHPSQNELGIAEDFGKKIREKMSGINGMGAHSLTIPGHKLPLLDHFLPEYVSRKITKPPVVDMKNCDRCGICARICPVSAVEKEKLMVDGNVCLRCFRCVRTCKKKARSIEFNAKPIIPLFFTLKNKVKHAPVLYI